MIARKIITAVSAATAVLFGYKFNDGSWPSDSSEVIAYMLGTLTIILLLTMMDEEEETHKDK